MVDLQPSTYQFTTNLESILLTFPSKYSHTEALIPPPSKNNVTFSILLDVIRSIPLSRPNSSARFLPVYRCSSESRSRWKRNNLKGTANVGRRVKAESRRGNRIRCVRGKRFRKWPLVYSGRLDMHSMSVHLLQPCSSTTNVRTLVSKQSSSPPPLPPRHPPSTWLEYALTTGRGGNYR